MSHYETLGVPTTATQAEIEVAFEEWKRTHSLDATADPARATSTAKQAAEAYRVLHDPKRRREYDRILGWGRSLPKNAAISEDEFRSWLDRGAVTEGLAAKIETETQWRMAQEAQEKARREDWLWLFRTFGGLIAFLLGLAVTVLLFWALIRAVRWLWEHPLW